MKFPRKSHSQLVSASGERALFQLLPDEWSIVKQHDDFGEDFVIEIFEPSSQWSGTPLSGPTIGQFAITKGSKFAIQLKTHAKSRDPGACTIPVDIKLSTLTYLSNLPYPAFIFVCILHYRHEEPDFLPAAHQQQYLNRMFFFLDVRCYSQVLQTRRSRTGQKTIRLGVPTINRLPFRISSFEHSHFNRLFANDPRHALVERCRLLAGIQNSNAAANLREIYNDTNDDHVAAESLVALALNGSRGDCTAILRGALASPSYIVVTSALHCLARQKGDQARQIFVNFCENYWSWYDKARARHSPTETWYAYYRVNELAAVDHMMVYCAAELASERDRQLVDFLFTAFQRSNHGFCSLGAYAGKRLSAVFGKSSLGLKRYMFDRLEKLVASEVERAKSTGISFTRFGSVKKLNDAHIMIDTLQEFYFNEWNSRGC
jgi:hypothetical protein